IDISTFRGKQAPFRVCDTIFIGAFFAALRVSPIMFDDEFAVRTVARNFAQFASFDTDGIRNADFFPGIANDGSIAKIAHRPAFIRFAVKTACDNGDRRSRNDLFYENDPATQFVAVLPLYIEPKIYFLKVYVERNKEIRNTRVEEHKCDQADETFFVV